MSNWFTIEEASEYIGLGKTNLYTLAQKGRIPSNKVGKKWLFEKSQLDAWVRANKPIESFFTSVNYHIEDNLALREPQREAYLAAYEFFKSGGNHAVIQIPVGCGKSGLASLLPFGIARGRVLITSPNLTIKEELFDTFDITNRQKCFWRKTGVLDSADMAAGPLACTLDSGNIFVAQKSHFVITNIHQLATNIDKWLTRFDDKFFDLIIIDEAHHSPAASWKKVLARFPEAKVVYMTATPFRSDKQEIKGTLIYRYPFRSATLKGYIKRLKASYIVPSEIKLSFKDKTGKKYTLKEVLKLKEEEWFSRSVALSKPCNKHIVDNSLEKLEELRLTGTHHQLIAVACSIDHAKEIRSMYIERGYNAEVIHSEQDTEKRAGIIRDLKNGTLDCIVQVQILGEGFDHKQLSVAAIFRPFRTLSPYIQFIGRILRVIVQNNPGHPDNLGHVVTHLGMNLNERLKEFKQFENDDQAFWENVIGGGEPEVPHRVKEGKERLTVEEFVVVNNEIVDSLWEEDFTTVEEEHIIQDLREKLQSLGLDPNMAENIVKKNAIAGIKQKRAAEPFAIQPQREWEEKKKRLNEKVKHTASILINNVGLEMGGVDIPYKFTTLNISARNNFTACLMMINREVGKIIGKEDRKDWTTDEFSKAVKSLEKILQTLTRRIKKAQKMYEESRKR